MNGREIIFPLLAIIGDEKPVSENTDNETLKILYRHTVEAGYPGDAFDTIYETYRNISGLFRETESIVRREILIYLENIEDRRIDLPNEYGVNAAQPFEGLFQRSGRDFPFTVNHTKKVYYSLETTKIHSPSEHADPLPLLMCYGRGGDPGAWLGDIIGVADEPPAGYTLLDEISVDR